MVDDDENLHKKEICKKTDVEPRKINKHYRFRAQSDHIRKHQQKRKHQSPLLDVSAVASQIRTAPNDGTEFQCMQARQGQHLAVKDRIPGHYLMSRSYCRNPPSVQCISCTPVEPCDRTIHTFGSTNLTPLNLSLLIQNFLIRLGLSCHGVLAGVSLCHIVLTFSMNSDSQCYFLAYGQFFSPYTAMFHLLCVISLISAFDRYDILHLDINHLSDLLNYRKSAIIIPIYLVTMLLSLYCSHMDNSLYLQLYADPKATIPETFSNNWQACSIYRSSGAILAWIIIVISDNLHDNMFYTHLINLNKYQR